MIKHQIIYIQRTAIKWEAEMYGRQNQSELASTGLVEFYVSEKTMLEEFLFSPKIFTPGCRGVDRLVDH